MGILARILHRTFFWSYERGAWQYDLAVGAIVVFVLLTPRSWFRDQPQVGAAAGSGQVVLLSESPGPATKTFRVDARVLASPIRTPELEHDLHDAMRKNVPEFKGHGFEILRIEPVRDAAGTVIAYEIEVKP